MYLVELKRIKLKRKKKMFESVYALAVFVALEVFSVFAAFSAFGSGAGLASGAVSVVGGAGTGVAGAGLGSTLKVSTNCVCSNSGTNFWMSMAMPRLAI